MRRYLTYRLLFIIPGVILVSIFAFFIRSHVPGDPVLEYIQGSDDRFFYEQDFFKKKATYSRTAKNLNLHLPSFYFSLKPKSISDTLNRIFPLDERESAKDLALKYGKWENIQNYRTQIYSLLTEIGIHKKDSLVNTLQGIENTVSFLLISTDDKQIDQFLAELKKIDQIEGSVNLKEKINAVEVGWQNIISNRNNLHSYIPTLKWHGFQNQYHVWFGCFIKGDMGVSKIDQKPVGKKIWEALRWTLIINIATLFFSFLFSILLGVYGAVRPNQWWDKSSQVLLFVAFAIPSFWLATLLVVFFTTSEYGEWTNMFPTAGLGNYRDVPGFWSSTGILISHLILPIFSLTVGSLAYLTRQMRASMRKEWNKDYITFYRAAGLPEKTLIWKQAFRNSLFPMITVLGSAIPGIFSGSLIIEVIFNIPGMGRLMFNSLNANDWAVVVAIIVMISVVTITSYLLTDIFYQWADPRVRIGASKVKV